MGIPSLTAQAQGLGSVSADNLNTYVQECDTVLQLRAFTGLAGMKTLVGGAAALGDGGGGTFYWNPASTATDDGINYIAAAGSSVGRWVRFGLGLSLYPSVTSDIPFIFTGGGAPISVGADPAILAIDFLCNISVATFLADRVCSATLDIWRVPYALYPPTIADSIVGANPPTLAVAIKSKDIQLIGWQTTIFPGDTLITSVSSNDVAQTLSLTLKVTK